MYYKLQVCYINLLVNLQQVKPIFFNYLLALILNWSVAPASTSKLETSVRMALTGSSVKSSSDPVRLTANSYCATVQQVL